jgi:FKBP12-rapamycin complex-associated protein
MTSLTTSSTESSADGLFSRYLSGLLSSSHDSRLKSSSNLRFAIEAELRGLATSDTQAKYLTDITNRVFQLLNSNNTLYKLSALQMIDDLIELRCDFSESMIIRFANQLRLLFLAASSCETVVLIKAAKSLGHLCCHGLTSTTLSSNSTQFNLTGAGANAYTASLTQDIVDFQIRQAFEWLNGYDNAAANSALVKISSNSATTERRHFAAVLILLELARSTPTLFNIYVESFLQCIWRDGIFNTSVEIRLFAIEALRVTLTDIATRENRWKQQCYFKIFNEASAIFNNLNTISSTASSGKQPKDSLQNSAAAIANIHGSLLVLGELLSNTGDFMLARFNNVADWILQCRNHSSTLIVKTVINLIPKLAHLSTQNFVANHLETCMNYILQQTSNVNYRDAAYISLGELAIQVGSELAPYIDIIISHIQQGLTLVDPNNAPKQTIKSKFMKSSAPSAFHFSFQALTCVGLLARALSNRLLIYMDNLIDLMFETGLSPTLIDSLTDITKNIPALLDTVQDRLLENIENILANPIQRQEQSVNSGGNNLPSTTNSPGQVPASRSNSTSSKLSISSSSSTAVFNSRLDPLIVLALKTLGTFDFTTQPQAILTLLRDLVVLYLDYPLPIIRRECAITILTISAKLIQSNSNIANFTGEMSRAVLELIKRVVVLSIADPVASIRLAIFHHLTPQLDRFLVQFDCLQSLFIASNDEIFAIRELAISVLGRLSSRNPAAIFPTLRKTLLQLLSELQQFQSDSIEMEESSKMLGILISHAPQLIKPYIQTILNVLAPKLTDMQCNSKNHSLMPANSNITASLAQSNPGRFINSGVASYVLSVLGKLSSICGSDLLVYFDNLIPLIIDTLQDRSSSIRRHVALHTLGQFLTATGYIIEPTFKYPSLLPTVLAVLKTERQQSIRLETLKVLGILGALDPVKYKQAQQKLLTNTNSNNANINTIPHTHKDSPTHTNHKPLSSQSNNNPLDIATELANSAVLDLSDPNSLQPHEEYYPTIAIAALLRILTESRLSQYHHLVIKAIMFIFRSLGVKSVPFLNVVVPVFLNQIRSCESGLREVFFMHLITLVGIVKSAIRNFLDALVDVCLEYWDSQYLLPQILLLVEELNAALADEFKFQLPVLVPRLLQAINADKSDHRLPTLRVLHAVKNISNRGNLFDFLHCLLPALIKLAENQSEPIEIRIEAVSTINRIVEQHSVVDHAARLIHPLARIMHTNMNLIDSSQININSITLVSQFLDEILSVLCNLIVQLGFAFLIFQPIIEKSIVSSSRPLAQLSRYRALLSMLSNKAEKYLSEFSFQGISNPNELVCSFTSFHSEANMYELQVENEKWLKDNFAANTKPAASTTSNVLNTNSSNGSGNNLAGTNGSAEVKFDGGATSNPSSASASAGEVSAAGPKKLQMSQTNLMKAWSASQRSTKDDWIVWMRGFSIELLKESPSAALRACSALAQKYPPLARELFNVAFLSCWNELFDEYQEDLIRSLEVTFKSRSIPPEIVQTLLNLAEFMEHSDKSLPIDIRTLGDLAERSHSFAKALHYKEAEFLTSQPNVSQQCIEALISINNKLQQTDAARGVLKYAQNNLQNANSTGNIFELKESWYEKLHRWEEALEAYEQKEFDLNLSLNKQYLNQPAATQSFEQQQLETQLGKMRCYKALGEHEKLAELSAELWNNTSDNPAVRRQIAPLAASAACALRQWGSIGEYIEAMEEQKFDGNFYRAIFSVHRNEFAQARVSIDRCLELLDGSLTALINESYTRAYRSLVKLQQLMELNEVIQYKQSLQINDSNSASALASSALFTAGNQFVFDDSKRLQIRRMWNNRLKGLQLDVDVMQEILTIRSLVMQPKDDIENWLKFAELCRKEGKLQLTLKTLSSLMQVSPALFIARPELSLPVDYPQMTLSCLDYLWASGYQLEAFQRLSELTNSEVFSNLEAKQAAQLQSQQQQQAAQSPLHTPLQRLSMSAESANLTAVELQKLRAKCYLKLGCWQIEMLDNYWDNRPAVQPDKGEQYNTVIPQVLNYFHAATVCGEKYYKAWHEFAMMNFRVVSYLHNHKNPAANKPTMFLDPSAHVVPAITAFFRSIWLQEVGENTRQDVLRILQLWFEWGARKEVEAALIQGINMISIDTWLAVIPQLIARIHTPNTNIRTLLVELLCRIGSAHPQALVYPLTVASKSPSSEQRRQTAGYVLNHLQKHSQTLVVQASTVSSELVRVAILWHELWHEAIEEASRYWFGQKNIEGMVATLAPLHALMDKGPQTLREKSFFEMFGLELKEAWEFCKKYLKSKNAAHLNASWDKYSAVFRRMNKQLGAMTELELHEVSPMLLSARDMAIAVPGSYRAGQPIVKISCFSPLLRVIDSKQHPRRLQISGSDGLEYPFLLKGHEDLRQDERCMQLFGLVNTLLTHDRLTVKNDLSIHRYSVIPLSSNTGLIEWVPRCDPIHSVIKQYRDQKKIMLNIEQRLMMKMAPDYQSLTLIQKIEVFQYALQMTTGQDLAKVLWLKSPTAEIWLDRRSNFTKSLATMSMVGYILGLGDRHTCNLLLERESGKIIHIDFGDCFEVAMNREKYPEKVPFRLTRMLVSAMEVAGIEGTFKNISEQVMRVLRKNRNSLMAVLEAFIYDPLINWKLLEIKKKPHSSAAAGSNQSNITAEAEKTSKEAAELESKPAAEEHKESKENATNRDNDAIVAKPHESTVFDPTLPLPNRPSSAHINPVAAEAAASLLQQQAEQFSSASALLTTATATSNQVTADQLNAQALSVISRVESKLKGTDFNDDYGQVVALDVPAQVQRLIVEATTHINLCQAYIGWCPFW